ncbi:MAG: hypothetical protein WEA04_03620 [Candidatus Andersenbacteria bacterium]
MVLWRTVRILILTIFLLGGILLGAGYATFGPFSASRWLAFFQLPEGGEEPSVRPLLADDRSMSLPHFPPLKITPPVESVFAPRLEESLSPMPGMARVLTPGRNCLMNDGTRVSLLPDCTFAEGQ